MEGGTSEVGGRFKKNKEFQNKKKEYALTMQERGNFGGTARQYIGDTISKGKEGV